MEGSNQKPFDRYRMSDFVPLKGLMEYSQRNGVQGPSTTTVRAFGLVVYNASYLPLIAGIAQGLEKLLE